MRQYIGRHIALSNINQKISNVLVIQMPKIHQHSTVLAAQIASKLDL